VSKTLLFLGLLVGHLAALSPSHAGWSDIHAGYAYGQYPTVHFRALPRHYHVIYWPVPHYYRDDFRYWYRPSAGCGC
jgi:hypothetical protein